MGCERFEDSIIARIDLGEETLASIREITLRKEIKLASINGLGTVNSFTVGALKTAKEGYKADEFNGYYEIMSPTRTTNIMKDKLHCHLHMNAGREDGNVVGGHLNWMIISTICELVIHIIDGRVGRSLSEKVELNLFDFHR